MPFPQDVLTADEQVVLHLRPHWRAAGRAALVTAFALAAVIMAWVLLPRSQGGWIGVGLVAAICGYLWVTRALWPVLVWRSTHYVLTDERLLLQDGVVSRDRLDLPLNRINDHVLRQG